MVTFNQPLFLILAILLIPGFWLISLLVRRIQSSAIGRFGRRQTLSHFSRFTKKTATVLALSLALSCLAIAASEPKLNAPVDTNTPTLNAIFVFDISRSMLAEDGPDGSSRLEAGIIAVERLLETYPDGRFGMVLYTSQVQTYPLTDDHQALRFILRDIPRNYRVRGEGSDPLLALEAASNLIEEQSYPVNTVFLISDGGRSLAPSAISRPTNVIMEGLTSQGVRIIAVGIGGLVPAGIPVYNPEGELIGYHEFEGTVVYTMLQEISLRQFAAQTSGIYLQLTGPDDLVGVTQANHLDSQPTVKETATNLVWLPVVLALTIVAFWLLARRFNSFHFPRFS